MTVYPLVLANIILLVTGQVLWKIGLQHAGGIKPDNIPALVLSPYIISGIVLYIAATFIWFVVLSKAALSAVYPLQSLAYVLGAVLGLVIFKENVPVIRWIGIFVVICGVYLIALK